MPAGNAFQVRHLGVVDYRDSWQQMQAFTDRRTPDTPDELWFLQHPPVYTLGKNARPGHILNAGDIPVVQSDRGGQVTYHGPGQTVVYILMDITRAGLGVRRLVTLMEQTIIQLLSEYGIQAEAKADAPGVYVNDAKIAALGLRVRKGRSFHGLAFNVDMDLEPFSRINPCGYEGLDVIQLKQFDENVSLDRVEARLQALLINNLTQPQTS
jgi:lipoyl(octanoyl) transferase